MKFRLSERRRSLAAGIAERAEIFDQHREPYGKNAPVPEAAPRGPAQPHNGSEGYPLRSLYFDTEYDGDFFDKESGIEVRKKLRLRLYDPTGDFAVLEMKQKQGEQQHKRFLRLIREDAQRLIRCDYSSLLWYPEPFAANATP